MEDPIIGIDLGTTFSCVAVYEEGHSEVLINDSGARVTPSYVAFTDHEVIVGSEAKNNILVDPVNTVYDSKRLIGRRFDDPLVQKDVKNWPFEVIEENGNPAINVNLKNGKKSYIPEQISSMILANMKKIAEVKLQCSVSRAVITVPAYFNDVQRQATEAAAKIAGLKVMQLLNEPTAAALAFALDKKGSGSSTVLIYDLGGGTFDVSILKICNGLIDVLAVNGDTHLGGREFDSCLVDYFIDEIEKKFNVDIRGNMYKKAVARLRSHCEAVKHTLSVRFEATITIDSLFVGCDYQSTITRAKFEELCEDLFRKTLIPLQKALSDANIDKLDIDDVVLVGGSTRIPRVQELVEEFFEGKVLNKTVNPDEVVACGAAIHAAVLKGEADEVIGKLSFRDATSLSYGIDKPGDLMEVIIPRNTPFPTKKTKVFITSVDKQTAVSINIYQGERPSVTDNHYLGEFILRNIPPKDAGEVQVEVTMEIDDNQMLQVTAREISTGAMQSLSITNVNGRLTQSEINRHIADAQQMKAEDEENKERIEAKNKLESLAFKSRRVANENSNSSITEKLKEEILDKVEEVLDWLESSPNAEKTLMETKFTELQDLFNKTV